MPCPSPSKARRKIGWKPVDDRPLSPVASLPVLAVAALAAVGGLYADDAALAAFGLLPLTAAALAWAWAAGSAWRVRGEGELRPDGAFPGEPVTYRVRIRNAKPWPAFVQLEATFQGVEPGPVRAGGNERHAGEPARGADEAARALPAWGEDRWEQPLVVPPWGTREWSVTVTPERRGVYRWRDVAVTGADPWGWYRVHRPLAGEGTLWVYPRLHPLGEGACFRRDGTDGTARMRGLWANRLYPAGVRDDGSGSARDIHWRATARWQRVQFKQYDGVWEQGVWVFLDVSRPGSPELFETALSLAASLLWERLQDGEPVAFWTNAASAGMPRATVRTAADFRALLKGMAAYVPGKAGPWEAIIPHLGAAPPGVTPVVVAAGEPAEALLAYAQRRGAWLFVPTEARVSAAWPGPVRHYRLQEGRFAFALPTPASASAATEREAAS